MNWQLRFSTLFIIFINVIQIAHSFRSRGNQSTITRNIEEENGPPVLSESIEGTAGQLPCNITPPILDDRVALVIWYKVGHKTPIYSVDTRDSNISKGAHWSDELYRHRLSFTVEGRSGTLTIKSTQQEDTGEYRCRVDFHKSPTRNSKVNLTIISPPESITILDSKGTAVEDYKLGPYNEGSVINITCVAVGGRPQPQVTWWHEDTLLDSSSHLLSDHRVGNILSLGKLKRKNLHMQLTCQASNNNITKPLSSSVTLDLNLRPLIVKLQGENLPLSAGNSYQLSCIVIGSRPAPTISWWKGSTPMKDTHEIINPSGNMTTSILTFTPTIDDRGKFLSCRAEQSMIPESGMEDGWKLDIYHIPIVSLELGTNSMNSSFREGIDVFFECNIKSNPWVYKVSWRHNGNILENNVNEGIIVANQSLVLQNVSRTRAGVYTCVGSNREGDGESNPVQLDIKFAPVCRPRQRTVYSTARHETVKIPCEIEANPLDATYIWKFNASLGETIDIPASLIALDYGRSIAHYTPIMENDYGTLLCWASNEIGDQSEPCVYTVMPAGEPDSLSNCTIQNQTSTSFQIECQEGFDGGLQQDFIMEVYVNGTTRHPKIFKSRQPFFEVRGLVPGVGYNVFLIAHNSKGRSNATILQIYTLKDPEKQTVVITFKKESRQLPNDEALYYNNKIITHAANATSTTNNYFDLSLAHAPVIEDLRPFLGIIIAACVGVVLLAIIIVIVVRVRGSSGRDRNNYTHPSTVSSRRGNNGNVSTAALHNGQSIQDVRIGRNTYHVTSSLDSIEKNPDIIPQDDHEEDEEWTTKGHSRTYATAALAEQNAATSSASYDHLSALYVAADQKSQLHFQQLPHYGQLQQQQQYGPYIQYDDRIPDTQTSGFSQKQPHQQQHQPQNQQANKTDLALSDVVTTGTQQQQQQQQQQHLHQQQPQTRYVPYCSATLGRQRQGQGQGGEMKAAEPNIYSQIDLAHHTLYSMSSLYGTKTITGVTTSHPSQMATFTTPPSILVHPGVTGQPSQSLSPASIVSHGVALNSNGLPQATGLLCTPISTTSLLAVAPTHATQMNLATCNLAAADCSERGDSLLNLTGKGINGEMSAVTLKLKTVPEELCQHENSEDGYVLKERNTATRF